MSRTPLVVNTDRGLHCPDGGFWIDPWGPTERAIVTHAHADHARPGSARYLAAADGGGLLRRRLGPDARIEALPYGERRSIGGVVVSLHPAGHVLGSAQLRIERSGEVWVVSGDYNVEVDPRACTPFEAVPCDTFITECTFGLPIFRWPKPDEVFDEIHRWWLRNRDAGRTSVLYAYALGKAQRVLVGLDESIGPIAVHGAVAKLLPAYEEAGYRMPDVKPGDEATAKTIRGRGLVVAPVSARGTRWLRKFAPVSDGFASGWMRIRGTRRRRSLDAGFVLSDHADWPGLHEAIEATGASRIGLTHGYTDVMARWLTEKGYETEVFETRFAGEGEGDEEPA